MSNNNGTLAADEPLHIHTTVKTKLAYFKSTNKVPNIIFHGPSGSGKKTIVNDFIHSIYEHPQYIQTYVMYVNCAEGKGIKFIREELKHFAKTNVIAAPLPNATEDRESAPHIRHFKSIVLFNADKLTNDAQSALRCCIENHSSTRFFMIVENKYNLLKPILSRLCEIHIPLPMIAINGINGIELKLVNLHRYKIERTTTTPATNKATAKRLYNLRMSLQEHLGGGSVPHNKTMEYCIELYDKGYSALDLIFIIEKLDIIANNKKYELLLEFHKVRVEIRHEPLLMFYIIERLADSPKGSIQ